ncbi:NB-ARC domain-containing protein [Tumidithrix helvetica PCC 7403]|uniref:NB-ARC domain-containing protein n=1 Tax=Tumidithrix helvetica TaxID=3457545 RepID=UPI003C9781EC
MVSNLDNFDRLFPEAAQNWDLARLYADLETSTGKELKPFEKACLRGLLCRYRPGQIAFKFAWTSGTLRVELNKGLYRSLEALTGNPSNTLKWEHIGEWLEAKGYKVSFQHQVGIQGNRIDWGEAPDIPSFFGRVEDISKLEQWIGNDRCRLAAVWGMGGIGKTALVAKLTEKVQAQFECTIWRSLRGAQPLSQLLEDILPFLVGGNLQGAADTSALLELLKTKRCLIVLDDFETILQDGELVGLYRQGCEGYAQLLERIGSERHQGCLIVVSREQPKEISTHQGHDLPVRSYKLGGLKRQGALELLKARGFSGSENGLEVLVEQYRGNPSALKIVATTIQDLFNGNISEFLKHTALALGDILRTLLYQQFERLSDLEKDVIYWLALKRRPVSLANLREDMDLQTSGSELINALESLRWRSLIEKVTEQDEVMFMLEPVVTKYVNKNYIDEVSKEVNDILTNRSFSKIRLLKSHALVEDRAPDSIRAIQIRLVLKPIKDKLAKSLLQAELTAETLHDILSAQLNPALQDGYAETNMALLGLWW